MAASHFDLIAVALLVVCLCATAYFALLARRSIGEANGLSLALAASDQKAGAILSAAVDAIVVTDQHERIVEFNPSAEKMFGFSRGDVVGRPVAELLIPPETRQLHHEAFERSRVTGQSTLLGKRRDLVALRADGSRIDIELYINKMPGTGPAAFAAFIRDITTTKKVAAERALLAQVVESSDDAIISKTLEGVVTSWNRGAEKIFGYSADEMVGQPINRLIPSESLDSETDILARIRTGQALDHYQTVRLRKDGQRIFVSLTVSPVRDIHGKIIGASKIARDVTERNVAEQKLRESEQRFRDITEFLPHLIATGDPGGMVEYVNGQWSAFTGKSAAELLGRGWLQAFHPDDRKHAEADVDWGDANRMAFGNELRIRRADGEYRWFSLKAFPLSDKPGAGTKWLGFAIDVDDHRKAEAKLRDQVERLGLLDQITRAIGDRQDLRSIFQVAIGTLEDTLSIEFGCVCLCDPADREVTVACVGRRSEPLAMDLAFGEKSQIEIDRGLSRCVRGELIYHDDISFEESAFCRRLLKASLRSLVLTPLSFEGKVFGVLMAGRRQPRAFSSGECEFLRQLSDNVALAMHQAQNNAALQAAYDDLRQSQQAAMQQERLRVLGQMSSGIAHDINNALSPMSLYTSMLLENEPDLSPKTRDYLEIAQRSLDDVAHTITRLEEFYRQREPESSLKPVEVNLMVPQVLDLTRARWNDMALQKGVVIQVKTDLAPDLPLIRAIESEVREALVNLIFNAVDAMPEGGTLTLRTGQADAGTPLQQIRVEVEDTGAGMDDDTRRRCLEPFFTTKGERGTGLGLAMVFGVAQRHNAEVEIDSAPGKGTTVRLSFPADSGVKTAVPTGADEPVAATRITSPLRILLVDDDPLMIKALRDALEGDGHSVVSAAGGQEGIDMFQSKDGARKFSLVITDLGMPRVDGRKVASAVKATRPSTPVIMLTGWGHRMVSERDVPEHVDRILSKPPRLRELRVVMADLVGQPH